jgi:hypothetical protein
MKPPLSTLFNAKTCRLAVYSATLALSLGVAWPAWAAAPFTVNGNGTVTDATTSLVWDLCIVGRTGSDCLTDTAAPRLYDWPGALAAAVTANASNYKGLNDWRVPNKNELESITKLDTWTTGQAAIDATAFPNIPISGDDWGEGATWTSTNFAPIWGLAWIVYFGNGYTGADVKKVSIYVRLVRSGQPLAPFDLVTSIPTLTAVGISGTSGNSTTLSATSSATGTGNWIAVPSGATEPTAAQVKAGVNYTGATVMAAGSAAMTAAMAQTFSVTGLSQTTAYDLYVVSENMWPNVSAVGGPVSFTTLETVAPITTAAPAISAGPTSSTASVRVTINEAGTGYWLLLPASSSPPSVQTLTGTGTSFGMTANTPATINLTGLTAGTSYKLYFVAKDTANNTQTTVSGGLAITTLTAAPVKSYTAASPTGTGLITAAFTGGSASCAYATSQFNNIAPPTGVSLPHGAFGFTTNDCGAGAALSVTITYPQTLPAGTQVYKYGPTTADASNHWHVLSNPSVSVSGNQITFTITDNDKDSGDSNPAVGFITDPVAVGVPAVASGATGIPTLSEWGVILLSGLMALAGLVRLRRQQGRSSLM